MFVTRISQDEYRSHAVQPISTPDFSNQESRDENCSCTVKSMVMILFWGGGYSEDILTNGLQNS